MDPGAFTDPSIENDREFLPDDIINGDNIDVKSFFLNYGLDADHTKKSHENSMAATALKWKRIDIYEHLLVQGVLSGPDNGSDEQIENILKEYSPKSRRKVRDLHIKHSKLAIPKHLLILNGSSRISHNSCNDSANDYRKLINRAFEDLNNISWIESILKIVSTAEELKVIFDFTSDSVEIIDPTKTSQVRGTCYLQKGYFLIGGKRLLDETTRNEVLGSLVHELCHFAMRLVYGNSCCPYYKDDEDTKRKFTEVSQVCEIFKEKELMVAYAYIGANHHAELIVRVPHLLALYNSKADLSKLDMCKEVFEDLFNFYETNVLRDLEKSYPLLRAKSEVRTLNRNYGVLLRLNDSKPLLKKGMLNIDLNVKEGILYIYSECCRVTLNGIYHELKQQQDFDSNYIFVDFEHIDFNLIKTAYNLCSEPKVIIYCVKKTEIEITSLMTKFADNKMTRKIIFVFDVPLDVITLSKTASMQTVSEKVKHTFQHLNPELQLELLMKIVCFQGIEVTLGSLFYKPDMLDLINLEQLIDKNFQISKPVEFKETENNLERSFLNPKYLKAEYSSDEFLNLFEKYQTFLISDESGAGKTTELKKLSKKLKQKFSTHWVVFMDLKEHCKVYELDGKNIACFDNGQAVTKFFIQKIFQLIETDFEAEVFTHLFNFNHVIFLMDGFDEISPKFNEFIMKLTIAIKEHSGNKLLISTRPHLKKRLQEKLSPFIVKLSPFSDKDENDFFKMFFQSMKAESDKVEQTMQDIEKFFSFSRKHYADSISNPLVWRMIAEIFEDQPDLGLTKLNRFSVYDQFTKKLIERCLMKGPVARSSIVEQVGHTSMKKFYQKTALECVFEKSDIITEIYFNIFVSQLVEPSLEEVFRLGLVNYSKAAKIQFVHQSFADFFAATFFAENVFVHKCSVEELKFVLTGLNLVLSRSECFMIRLFLNDALALNKIEPTVVKSMKLANVKFSAQCFSVLKQECCDDIIKAIPKSMFTNNTIETNESIPTQMVFNADSEHEPKIKKSKC